MTSNTQVLIIRPNPTQPTVSAITLKEIGFSLVHSSVFVGIPSAVPPVVFVVVVVKSRVEISISEDRVALHGQVFGGQAQGAFVVQLSSSLELQLGAGDHVAADDHAGHD